MVYVVVPLTVVGASSLCMDDTRVVGLVVAIVFGVLSPIGLTCNIIGLIIYLGVMSILHCSISRVFTNVFSSIPLVYKYLNCSIIK